MNKKRFYKVITHPATTAIVDLCTFGGFLVSVWVNNNFFKAVLFAIFSIVFLYSFIFILTRWLSIKRAKRNIQRSSLRNSEDISTQIHLFFHDLRDCNNYLDIHSNLSSELFRSKALNLCNRIEKFFNSVLQTNNSVNVCIKLLDTNSISDSDYRKWKTYTFVRSQSTDTNRSNHDKEYASITENTDFEMIVSDEPEFRSINYFISENLENTKREYNEKYEKDNKHFKNSNPDASYKSTIVVPIRVSADLASPRLKIDSSKYSHHILGFLCIDSDETFDDVEKDFRFSIFMNSAKYACAFADSLYHFFESYLIHRIFEQQPFATTSKEDCNEK